MTLRVYDENNIFAKILRKEIPSTFIYENEVAVAFHDIAPQAPVHILVLPKGAYCSAEDFYASASDKEIKGFHDCISAVITSSGLAQKTGGSGFRLIANAGKDARQEVPHYHIHILGGCDLGGLLPKL